MTTHRKTAAAEIEELSADELLMRWDRVATKWQLSKADAAALLRLRRSEIVGARPRADISVPPLDRVRLLVRLDAALDAWTRSPAATSRWIRFPSPIRPEQRRVDMIANSDTFLRTALRVLEHGLPNFERPDGDAE